MAIGTNSTIEFHGTADTVHSSPATVADGAFSVASDVSQWTNDDDAPFAYFELQLTAAGLGGAPAAGTTVDLFTRIMDLRGTTDDSLAPQTNFEHYYLGSFPVDDQDADQNIVIGPVRLPNPETSTVHEFYIKNNMGVATGTTWELYVTPVTFGPHA
jgi:hypothetical protein